MATAAHQLTPQEASAQPPAENVVEPEQHGFGTKLIEGSIAAELAGETRLVFQPQGLRCEITIPMKAATVHSRADAGAGPS